MFTIHKTSPSFSQKRISPSEEPVIIIKDQISGMDIIWQSSAHLAFNISNGHIPVIIPLSEGEYSTQSMGPAWHANTASHVPLVRDHTLAVQSSLPVIIVSPVILIDL
jgi:hypothetical protein